MALTAISYFTIIKEYLYTDYYGVEPSLYNDIKLKEKIESRSTPIEIDLKFNGKAFAIKLDQVNKKGSILPLFHFLKDDSNPWARRCDFIIFQLYRNKIKLYCIEFKSGTFPEKLPNQLKASVAWCYSLHSTIKHYTGYHRKLEVCKFVFSNNLDHLKYLDESGRYLKKDLTISHYLYKDVKGMNINDLENTKIEEIK